MIPYIVKWPKDIKVKRSVVDNPVELRDFLPTFIDVAGAAIPPSMDGKSLLPLVKSSNYEWREYIDLEHATCYSQENYWYALTDGKIKYVWRFYTGEEELYDLVQDKNELVNLVNDKGYQDKLLQLRSLAIKNLSERGEMFVKDGSLVVQKSTLLYSPNYPQTKK